MLRIPQSPLACPDFMFESHICDPDKSNSVPPTILSCYHLLNVLKPNNAQKSQYAESPLLWLKLFQLV